MSDDMHAMSGGAPHAPQGSDVVPLPSRRALGASYLIRTEDADGTCLQLFTRDEKNELTAQDQLTEYLTSLIQVNQCAIGPAVRAIWRWDADDSRHEMYLSIISVRQEADDFSDEDWLLEEPGNTKADITFTVTIDQKGQQ